MTSARCATRFVAEYFKTYGYQGREPDRAGEAARGRPRPARASAGFQQHDDRRRAPARRPARGRAIHFARGAERRRHRGRRRARALAASPRRGPLVIEEFDATTVVPPDASVHRDAIGNIVLELEARHEGRSHHLRGHQERPRFDRRRHGLHGGAHRALGDRQGRDGFLRRAVRRRRPDGGAGQDHRPASRAPYRKPWRRCWRSSATICTTATP